MDLFIAICCDRHIDEVVRVFSTENMAVAYCKAFVPPGYELEEEELTHSMKKSGWLYFATYGSEGDSVRVERGTLDPSPNEA